MSHFSEILHFLYDTLSLDYSSLQYFTSNVEVIGKEIYLIGLKFVFFILKEIKNLKIQIKIQKEKENGFANRRTSSLQNMNTGNGSNLESEAYTQQTSQNPAKDRDVIIPVVIEDFLERIDILIEVYVDKYDKILKEKIKEAEKINAANGSNVKEKRFKSLREASIDVGVMKWVFKEIQDEFMKHAQSSCKFDFQIKILKFFIMLF